jgi:hypothetical protein
MSVPHSLPDVFDGEHYAATPLRKAKRSLQLGPRYYLWDLPRYFLHRRNLALPSWDFQAVWNPLREFRSFSGPSFPLPPGYEEALGELARVGIRISMPRSRLEALLGAWWEARAVEGLVIECGSYRGATALLVAWLGWQNHLDQSVLLLDTFMGIPATSNFDLSRNCGEFLLQGDHVCTIRRQAEALGILDRIEIHQGLFTQTFATLQERNPKFAFVHIDANIYQGTWDACAFTLPRISPGGIVVFDDYNGVCDLGARLAIDRYLAGSGLRPAPLAGCSAYLRIKS